MFKDELEEILEQSEDDSIAGDVSIAQDESITQDGSMAEDTSNNASTKTVRAVTKATQPQKPPTMNEHARRTPVNDAHAIKLPAPRA
ncbi:hypothetical protein CCHR01_01374 [Colletotrichum chrysophilum]|uniref:Uncharacterized protein n=1 Tax=Colletotrichum chrysophilum TaxID=1836956 RepID=A0AAD9EQD9_9PEZI|nr:hypothetical protein CCHR01_01374 [Colletotrichum chrysophilum]